jgi:hypothetical protein
LPLPFALFRAVLRGAAVLRAAGFGFAGAAALRTAGFGFSGAAALRVVVFLDLPVLVIEPPRKSISRVRMRGGVPEDVASARNLRYPSPERKPAWAEVARPRRNVTPP